MASLEVPLEANRLRKFLPHPHPRSLKSQLHLRLEGQAKVREGQGLVGREGDGSNQDSIPPWEGQCVRVVFPLPQCNSAQLARSPEVEGFPMR